MASYSFVLILAATVDVEEVRTLREKVATSKSIADAAFDLGPLGDANSLSVLFELKGVKPGGLLAALDEIRWRRPLEVQMLIRGPEDDCWGLWMMTDGQFREVPIPGAHRRLQSPDRFGALIRARLPTETSVPSIVSVYSDGDSTVAEITFRDDSVFVDSMTHDLNDDGGAEEANAMVAQWLDTPFEIQWKTFPDARFSGRVVLFGDTLTL